MVQTELNWSSSCVCFEGYFVSRCSSPLIPFITEINGYFIDVNESELMYLNGFNSALLMLELHVLISSFNGLLYNLN